MNNISELQQCDDNHEMTLPISSSQLADFLSSLLGKPEKIKNEYHGQFSLDKDDIVSFHHLIEQRIHQQNVATLIRQEIQVIYHDSSSISHNNIKSFLEHNEIRKLIPLEVNLTFSYLILFQQKNIPEKQDITISINCVAGLSYIIEHTARTWGSDIDAILRSRIETILYEHREKPSKVAAYIYRKGPSMLGWGIFLCSLIAAWFITNGFINNQLQELQNQLVIGNNIESINSNIQYIGNYISAGMWPRYSFYLFFYLVLMGLLSAEVCSWLNNMPTKTSSLRGNYGTSYLVFTEAARKYKDGNESNIKRARRSWHIAFIASIAAGIFSNILFTILTKILI